MARDTMNTLHESLAAYQTARNITTPGKLAAIQMTEAKRGRMHDEATAILASIKSAQAPGAPAVDPLPKENS